MLLTFLLNLERTEYASPPDIHKKGERFASNKCRLLVEGTANETPAAVTPCACRGTVANTPETIFTNSSLLMVYYGVLKTRYIK